LIALHVSGLECGQRPEQRGLWIKYGVAIEHWGPE
jgi:hypothetical protein